MPESGKSLMSLDTTPCYHCVSRFVHHAFLYGQDTLTVRTSIISSVLKRQVLQLTLKGVMVIFLFQLINA
ncbi:MAG: hypothetical protein QNL62_04175 [Gammaproteobacteria bacterium]|nr:hypothetical protein [Gammaproteobacteria bacterium]